MTGDLLRLGAASTTLEECLAREFHAAAYCLETGDFYEGVRAAVIDKDRKPQWPSAQPGAVQSALASILAKRPGQPDPMFSTGG